MLVCPKARQHSEFLHCQFVDIQAKHVASEACRRGGYLQAECLVSAHAGLIKQEAMSAAYVEQPSGWDL
jgi:hypothetical protein